MGTAKLQKGWACSNVPACMTWLIFLSCSIFGHEGEAADNILYVNWLNMVRAGLIGLEYYTPEKNKWRQVSCIKQPMRSFQKSLNDIFNIRTNNN